MITYFARKMSLKDFEAWDVRIDSQHYTLVIADQFRPAAFDDFEIPNLIFKEM